MLASLTRALRLDDAERAHLFDLAHAASPVARPRKRRNPRGRPPPPSLHWTLDAITTGPALVRNGRMDVLATNTLGRAFHKDTFDMPGQPPDIARFTFLDERALEFHPDWETRLGRPSSHVDISTIVDILLKITVGGLDHGEQTRGRDASRTTAGHE